MRKPATTRTDKVLIGKDLFGGDVASDRKRERPIYWKSHVYPLCDTEWKWDGERFKRLSLGERAMTTDDCLEWHRDNNLAEPPSSACKKCPYRDNQMWREMRHESPDEFEEACEFDDRIRVAAGMKGETFTHRDLIPLRDVNLGEKPSEEMGLFPCDGGVCGT